MSKVNMGKVILGGIVGGIVLNIIDYLVNGVWLAPQWMAAASKLSGANPMSGNAIAGYVVGDFIFAIMIVWVYAAIRTRYGPGAGTGIKASLAVWVLTAVSGAARGHEQRMHTDRNGRGRLRRRNAV
jgi:hypothetical protein